MTGRTAGASEVGATDAGASALADEQIVSLVQRGQSRHFAELVLRHQDAIFGMAARFTRSPGEAQDVAQEVFLRAYRSLDGFKGEAKFSTWLYRICYNLCIDWVRKKSRPGQRSLPIDGAADVADPREDPERASIDAEQGAAVRKAVDGLEERYRTVVELLYYQKLSYERIAEILQLPLKTVETRLYRARKLLRDALVRDMQ